MLELDEKSESLVLADSAAALGRDISYGGGRSEERSPTTAKADFDLARFVPASCSANCLPYLSSLVRKENMAGTDWLLLGDVGMACSSVKRALLFKGLDGELSSSASRRAMASSLAHGSLTGLRAGTPEEVRTGIITNPVLLDVGVAASFGGDGCVGVVSCGTGKMVWEGCTAPGVGGRLLVVFNDSAKACARSSSS
jgi:hypothetical protein